MTERSAIEIHAEIAVRSFEQSRPRYESFAEQIHRIIDQSFKHSQSVRIHDVQYRAKKIDSFRNKCLKSDSENKPKYDDPIKQITDLSGVRIILFFPDDVKAVCEFIEEHFEIVEKRDVGEARFAASGSFGYQSIHFLVKHHANRLKMPDFAGFAEMICEIQVRTILQHAWAEMEHDIQYKSPQSLPAEIRRKFMALAGMLEIADREFQSIQSEDNRLRKSIKRSLEEQLTKESFTPGENSASTANAIPRDQPKGNHENSFRARDLVISGNYSRAVEVYSQQIEIQPAAHTLYVGRARARFLAGDRDGALQDIDAAQKLNGDDPAVVIARNQIESGNVQKPAANSDRATSALQDANAALAGGDAETAFEYFAEAQKAGHSHAFSIFNMAMSCTLARDTIGARRLMADLKPIPGTPMEINILALIAVIEIFEDTKNHNTLQKLAEQRRKMVDFSFEISPLRNLENGLLARGVQMPEAISEIFSIVKGGDVINTS